MKRFIRSSSSQESALQESHEARRFYTARVKRKRWIRSPRSRHVRLTSNSN
jgi:ribosomal protein S21